MSIILKKDIWSVFAVYTAVVGVVAGVTIVCAVVHPSVRAAMMHYNIAPLESWVKQVLGDRRRREVMS